MFIDPLPYGHVTWRIGIRYDNPHEFFSRLRRRIDDHADFDFAIRIAAEGIG